MIITIGIVIGLIVGSGSLFLYGRKYIREGYISIPTVKEKLKQIPKKRGLLDANFTWANKDTSKNQTVNPVVEFHVVDDGGDMVKIKVDNIILSDLTYSYSEHMKSYYKAYDNRWYELKDPKITWLGETKMSKRRRVIKDILSLVKE